MRLSSEGVGMKHYTAVAKLFHWGMTALICSLGDEVRIDIAMEAIAQQ